MITIVEGAVGADRSQFIAFAEVGGKLVTRFKMTCQTEDSESCTKAIRLVSGSENAVHPRDWNDRPALKAVYTDILYWELSGAPFARCD